MTKTVLMHNVPKWSDTSSDSKSCKFETVSDHFGTLCIKRLNNRQQHLPKYFQFTLQCMKNCQKASSSKHIPVKVFNKNTRKRCEICSKLTIKTP